MGGAGEEITEEGQGRVWFRGSARSERAALPKLHGAAEV